ITNFGAWISFAEIIREVGGGERMRMADDRFEKGRFEWQHLASIGAGALGKNDEEHVGLKDALGLLVDAGDVGSFCALDEQRAALMDEPSEERPVAHFTFRNENTRGNGTEHEDIDVTQMI